MRLTRVYVDAALSPGGTVELPPDTASHVAKVLRARAGDELILFNGDGREFNGSIDAVRGSRVSASVGDGRAVDRESPLHITLVQCLPRGDRMDLIVQKATELGVARIVPVLSQRSVVRLDRSQSMSKALHWRAVAVGACEQCGRNRLPLIDAPQPLLQFLGQVNPPMPDPVAPKRWVFEPDSPSPGRFEAPAGPRGAEGRPVAGATPVAAALIAVGPEGGLAADELEAFRVAGFVRVGLGPRILRAETAAIAAMVWLQAWAGDMPVHEEPAAGRDA